MPAVFVHGVPETPAIWDALRAKLQRDDVIALQLPGFGCPRPTGFGATKEEYVAWLVGELEPIAPQGPIDLVGHDWGGGFVVRARQHPRRSRALVGDATSAGLGDVDFEWHDFAKIWQTPGDGEEFYAQNLAQPGRGARRGLRACSAFRTTPRSRSNRPLDQTMADCILTLYRSAIERRQGMGARLPRHRRARARVVLPSDDPFLAADVSRNERAAQRARPWPSSTGSATGGCCRTRTAARPRLEEFWASMA